MVVGIGSRQALYQQSYILRCNLDQKSELIRLDSGQKIFWVTVQRNKSGGRETSCCKGPDVKTGCLGLGLKGLEI